MSDHGHEAGHGDHGGGKKGGGNGLVKAVSEVLSPEFLTVEGQKVADKTAGMGGQGAQAIVSSIESILPPAATLGQQKMSGSGGGHGGDHGGGHH